ncbi:MAG: hypothetical protein Q8S84_02765 [bacterium]|nr:hypothetical protein [bacterium]MDP3380458.1 hypothetical protein [bacterium]
MTNITILIIYNSININEKGEKMVIVKSLLLERFLSKESAHYDPLAVALYNRINNSEKKKD